MKRIKITAICISLLATLSTVGCMCTPGYHPGYSFGPPVSYDYGGYGYNSSGCSTYGPSNCTFDASCGPCGTASCDPCGYTPCAPEIAYGSGYGIFEYGGYPCAPCPPRLNCRSALYNIGNGTLLVGRGVLDVAAAPFVLVGNLLSSGCQYEVIKHCPEVSFCGPGFQTFDPCGYVGTSGCSSGCDSCGNGHYNDNGNIDNGYFGNGHIEDGYSYNRVMLSPPPTQRRNTSVIQAAYREPITPGVRPGVRFVQPR